MVSSISDITRIGECVIEMRIVVGGVIGKSRSEKRDAGRIWEWDSEPEEIDDADDAEEGGVATTGRRWAATSSSCSSLLSPNAI